MASILIEPPTYWASGIYLHTSSHRGKLYLTRVIRGYLLLEFVAVGCGYLFSPIAPALFFALISDTWADCTVCILESAPDILSPCLLSASVHRLPLSPFLLVQVR